MIATAALVLGGVGVVTAVVRHNGDNCDPTTSACGPLPPEALTGQRLTVPPNGLMLLGTFNCGGRLAVRETTSEVVVTFTPPTIPPGAGSCARVLLVARLTAPLGDRPVIDGVSHRPLDLLRWQSAVQVCHTLGHPGAASGGFEACPTPTSRARPVSRPVRFPGSSTAPIG